MASAIQRFFGVPCVVAVEPEAQNRATKRGRWCESIEAGLDHVLTTGPLDACPCTWTSKNPKTLARYAKTESMGNIRSIVLDFLGGPGIPEPEVDVDLEFGSATAGSKAHRPPKAQRVQPPDY